MRMRWRRRVDPRYPYRAERAVGSTAFYAAAWQLLVPSTVAALAAAGWAGTWPTAWLFLPSIVSALTGTVCALSDRLEEDGAGWWGPWTLLISPAGAGLVYVVGPRPGTGAPRGPER